MGYDRWKKGPDIYRSRYWLKRKIVLQRQPRPCHFLKHNPPRIRQPKKTAKPVLMLPFVLVS